MFTKQEGMLIGITIIVLAFTVSFLKPLQFFVFALGAMIVIIGMNVLAKKAMAYALDGEIEMTPWKVERYGFGKEQHFKKPVSMGLILPPILSVITLGIMQWLAALTFDIRASTHRAVKRHGIYSFSEMTEYHVGIIAAAGIFANLFLAIIAYIIGIPELARWSIYYATWNMLPISDLDGTKILFGSMILWTFTAAVTVIALGFAFLTI